MAESTYFGSRLRAGTAISDGSVGVGDVLLTQTVEVVGVSNGNADATLTLPEHAQIRAITAAKTVAWVLGAGTATTLLVTAGSAAGGAQYMASADLASATNASGPSTVATNLACADIDGNGVVHVRVATNGTVLTTLPRVRFTITYAMHE